MEEDAGQENQEGNKYKSTVEWIKEEESRIGGEETGAEVRIDMSELIGGLLEEENKPSYIDSLKLIDSEFKGAVVIHPTRIEATYKEKAQEQNLKARKMDINMEELVLPTLSLSDQISELERINMAISEKVLDKKHMQIVAEEAYGLKRTIESGSEGSEMGNAMKALRDRRLSDVISRIDTVGV